MRRHIIAVLVENESGALSRIAGLFSARGYNIESLTVAPTHDPSMSRMTIITSGTEPVIEQINKQLNKLVDVIKLTDLTDAKHIEREMLLLKVAINTPEDAAQLQRLVAIFRAEVIDVCAHAEVIEVRGSSAKLDALIDVIGTGNIIEMVRSGAMGIARGERALQI